MDIPIGRYGGTIIVLVSLLFFGNFSIADDLVTGPLVPASVGQVQPSTEIPKGWKKWEHFGIRFAVPAEWRVLGDEKKFFGIGKTAPKEHRGHVFSLAYSNDVHQELKKLGEDSKVEQAPVLQRGKAFVLKHYVFKPKQGDSAMPMSGHILFYSPRPEPVEGKFLIITIGGANIDPVRQKDIDQKILSSLGPSTYTQPGTTGMKEHPAQRQVKSGLNGLVQYQVPQGWDVSAQNENKVTFTTAPYIHAYVQIFTGVEALKVFDEKSFGPTVQEKPSASILGEPARLRTGREKYSAVQDINWAPVYGKRRVYLLNRCVPGNSPVAVEVVGAPLWIKERGFDELLSQIRLRLPASAAPCKGLADLPAPPLTTAKHSSTAQQPVPSSSASSVSTTVKQADRLIQQGDYQGTLDKLKAAQKVSPDPYRADRIKRLEAYLALGLHQQPAPAQVLFNGKLTDDWQKVAWSGGNFDKFAHVTETGLQINVPPGNQWGKTGIASRKAVLTNRSAKSGKLQKLTFEMTPSKDARFVIAFLPELAKYGDEWDYHEARIALVKEKDKPHQLVLWIKRDEVDRVDVDPLSISKLAILVYPDGEINVTNGGGKLLLQGLMMDDAIRANLKLDVLAHPSHINEPAKMVLKEIRFQEEKWHQPISPDAMLDKVQELNLFVGGRLGRNWKRYAGAGGNFAKHARLNDEGLVVEVPEKSSWARVGLKSSRSLVWLDNFGKGAQEELTFTFDPNRTSGFAISLHLKSIFDGNVPGWPSLILHWRQTAEGKARATLIRDAERTPLFDVEVPPVAPKKIIVVLTPKGVQFLAKGFPDKVMPWKELMEGTGIRLAVYSKPDKADEPVTMALSGIRLRRKPGEPLKEPKPAPGVEPLPVKDFFDGKANEWFEPAAVRLDAKQCAKYAGGKLVANVPAKKTWWGKCGLLSSRMIGPFHLDRRIRRTPYRLTWQFDPKATNGIQVMFAGGKYPEMWADKILHFSFIQANNGPHKGDYALDLGGSGQYTRWVNGDWVNRHWDGRIIMELFSDSWLRLRIPGGPSIRDHRNALIYGGYMTVYAHPPFKRGGAHMELEKITGQWVMPDGMNWALRWALLDDDEFDPEEFIRDLVWKAKF